LVLTDWGLAEAWRQMPGPAEGKRHQYHPEWVGLKPDQGHRLVAKMLQELGPGILAPHLETGELCYEAMKEKPMVMTGGK
jgi:hypothetical protein